MATQFSDPALGGTSGFASQYTPIQFAPLVSLTGPIQGPATPTATAPAAPTAQPLRLPMMGGMAEMPDNAYMTGEMQTGTPGAGFVNPLAGMTGSQIGAKALDALSFLSSPLSFAAGYMATGKTPSESMAGFLGGGAQGQGMFGGLRDFLFGQQQPSVPLGDMRAPAGAPNIEMNAAVMNDARAIGQSMGLSPDLTDALAAAAAGMVAQGTDPIVAISTVMSDAMQFGPMAGGGLPAPSAASQGLPALSRNAFDLTAPVAPSPAQTFGLGRPGEIVTTPISGGEAQGGFAGMGGGFTGGGWSPGDVAGAYSDVTGYE